MEALLAALQQAGVIDAETAGMLARNNDIDAAREWAETILITTMQGALSAQQQRLLDLLVDTESDPTAPEWDRFWADEDTLFYEAITPDIARIVTERATIAAIQNGNTFSFTNGNAQRWAQTYYLDGDGFGSVPNLNLTSRRDVATAFDRWITGQLGRRGFPDFIDELTPTFGPARARLIGVTETTRIFIEAQKIADQDNPYIVAYRWQAANDELMCPICGAMNGQIRRKGQSYAGGLQIPAHPLCRCHESRETAATLGELPAQQPPTAPERPQVAEVVEMVEPTAPAIERAPTFAKTKDAQVWAQQRFPFQVNYGKLDADTANAINQTLLDNLTRVPSLDKSLSYVGSSQARNLDIKAYLRPSVEKNIRDFYGNVWNEDRIKKAIDLRLNKYVNKIPGNVYAYSHSAQPGTVFDQFKGINVNEKFGKDFAAMTASLARDVASGWHPIATGSVKAVIDHELGHEIDKLFGMRTDPAFLKVVDRIKALPGGIGDNLSNYAKTNTAEVIAEGWAEYVNNPTPREPARLIGEFILDKVKAKP